MIPCGHPICSACIGFFQENDISNCYRCKRRFQLPIPIHAALQKSLRRCCIIHEQPILYFSKVDFKVACEQCVQNRENYGPIDRMSEYCEQEYNNCKGKIEPLTKIYEERKKVLEEFEGLCTYVQEIELIRKNISLNDLQLPLEEKLKKIRDFDLMAFNKKDHEKLSNDIEKLIEEISSWKCP
jgi:hypothetical protein